MRQSHSQKRVTANYAVVALEHIHIHLTDKTWLTVHMGAQTIYWFMFMTFISFSGYVPHSVFFMVELTLTWVISQDFNTFMLV